MVMNCYLAVDKDGTEKISNYTLLRRKGIKSLWWGLIRTLYSKNDYNKWCDTFAISETDALPFSGVILPKGTIEKILGYKLTWKDESVILKVK